MASLSRTFALWVGWALFTATSGSNHVFKERMKPRHDFVKTSRVDAYYNHSVVIAIKQYNTAILREEFHARSDPSNALYQQWMDRADVQALTQNDEGFTNVEKWLASHNATIEWLSRHKNFIRASASAATWEELLDTAFYHWEDRATSNLTSHVRAEKYSIPREVFGDIHSIYYTCQAQSQVRDLYSAESLHLRAHRSLQSLEGLVTPKVLKEEYAIPPDLSGDPEQKQAIFATIENFFSPDDLEQFQDRFGLRRTPVTVVNQKGATDDCSRDICDEGNLDTQYILSIAEATPTLYYYVDATFFDPFLEFVIALDDEDDPPCVCSISYGSFEHSQSEFVVELFNLEAMKLGLAGVTLVVASGDDGVANFKCGEEPLDSCNEEAGTDQWALSWDGKPFSGKGYFPSFPASSPYVTAVGGSQMRSQQAAGASDAQTATATRLIAAQSQEGGVITTGGGFSVVDPTPEWQQKAVDAYFADLDKEGIVPAEGFNRNGRGYPDVSVLAVDYAVVLGGGISVASGTSAAAPVFAAMLSLVNAERKAQGLPRVGFINPTLYGAASRYFTDISEGDNRCCSYRGPDPAANAICCKAGFTAIDGWDPVTGLGSMQYADLLEVLTEFYTGPGEVAAFNHTDPNKRSDAGLDAPTVKSAYSPDMTPPSFTQWVAFIVGIGVSACCAVLCAFRQHILRFLSCGCLGNEPDPGADAAAHVEMHTRLNKSRSALEKVYRPARREEQERLREEGRAEAKEELNYEFGQPQSGSL